MKRFMNPMSLVFIGLMIYSSIRSGRFNDPREWFLSTILILPAIIIALSFHEFAHAVVAYKLGDDTPRLQGRVTINPAAHVDAIGFICLLFIGFGWGKPVMVNPRNFKSRRRDEILVSASGVTMNFILAVIFMGILSLIAHAAPTFGATYMENVILTIIYYIVRINLVLMIFNLIPVPPLDGFNLVTEIFNIKHTELYYKIYQNGFLILLVLILFDITDLILGAPIDFLENFLFSIFF